MKTYRVTYRCAEVLGNASIVGPAEDAADAIRHAGCCGLESFTFDGFPEKLTEDQAEIWWAKATPTAEEVLP